MNTEVTELLKELRAGRISLDEVAQNFRERHWPTKPQPPSTYLELAAQAQQDPEPDVPGSFDDVTAAYDRGQLTRDQYRVLADAAAAGMRAEDERER